MEQGGRTEETDETLLGTCAGTLVVIVMTFLFMIPLLLSTTILSVLYMEG